MKNLFYILLFLVELTFGQTVLDYGCVRYQTKEEAIAGKADCSDAMEKMKSDWGTIVFPGVGWFYIGKTTILKDERNSVTTESQGNRSVNLITDKPIDLFLIINSFAEIKGFTVWYVGKEIKDCYAVRMGGDARNTGQNYLNIFSGKIAKNFRPRRTESIGADLDFDMVGDGRHALTSQSVVNVNPDFIEDYGASPLYINYDESGESSTSFNHFLKVRGTYKWINTGFKIDRKANSSQSLNTFDISVKIWGARKFADISGVNFGSIQIMGQEQPMIGVNEKVNLWDVTGGTMKADIWVYDVGGRRWGQYHVNGLEIFGLSKLRLEKRNDKWILPNTNFNESILK